MNFWGGIDPGWRSIRRHGLSAQDTVASRKRNRRIVRFTRRKSAIRPIGRLRDHQPFVVVGHPGKGTERRRDSRPSSSIPAYAEGIPDLQKAFPGVQFIPAENSAIELTKITKERQSAKPKKLGPAAEQPAKSDTVAERYRRTSGNELGDIVARTQSQQDAVDFFRLAAKTVKFFAPPNSNKRRRSSIEKPAMCTSMRT